MAFLFHCAKCTIVPREGITHLSTRCVRNLSKPLPQRRSQNARKLAHVSNNEPPSKWESIHVPLAHQLQLAIIILCKLSRLQFHDALLFFAAGARAIRSSIHNHKHNHNAQLLRVAHEPRNAIVVLADAIRNHKHELPQLGGGAARPAACVLEQLYGGVQQCAHVGAALVEREAGEDADASLVAERPLEWMVHAHGVAEAHDAQLARLQRRQRFGDKAQRLERQFFATTLRHALAVVQRDHQLVASLCRHRAPHPDLVLFVARSNIRNDALHVETFAGAVVAA